MPTLKIRLLNGKNLVARDVTGTSDPYCELRIGSQKKKSRKVFKTRNPQWNEAFTFLIPGNPMTESLLISVFDYDLLTRDDPMGYCLIPLNTLIRGQPTLKTEHLMDVSHGTITLELTAVDFGIPPGGAVPNAAYGQNYQYPYGMQQHQSLPPPPHPTAHHGMYPPHQHSYPPAPAPYNYAQPAQYPPPQAPHGHKPNLPPPPTTSRGNNHGGESYDVTETWTTTIISGPQQNTTANYPPHPPPPTHHQYHSHNNPSHSSYPPPPIQGSTPYPNSMPYPPNF